ncbi:hypothetical protein MWH28_02150 [Natroniella sulfidigena]|uniref:hypothetical protein n=1 Tax=Natroniella sulfidigena TaxID=723921 RepID=UPI00200B1550|nr:hypothetical protein [Natroniella sulfidigena]MCK8816166.1 hypothetical protein [Natroniella sulfidigena]
MRQEINFTFQQLQNWKQSFSLQFAWQDYYPASIAATLALSTLNKEVDTGYYLAQQELRSTQLPKLNDNLTLTSQITRQKKLSNISYISCQSRASTIKQNLIELKSKLIKPEVASSYQDNPYLGDSTYWRSFTTQQVYNFSQLSSDPNQIHLTEQPVVQGMLLLLSLEDYLAQQDRFLKKLKINYLRPVTTGQRINLAWVEKNSLLGIIKNQIHFKLKLKEEF